MHLRCVQTWVSIIITFKDYALIKLLNTLFIINSENLKLPPFMDDLENAKQNSQLWKYVDTKLYIEELNVLTFFCIPPPFNLIRIL